MCETKFEPRAFQPSRQRFPVVLKSSSLRKVLIALNSEWKFDENGEAETDGDGTIAMDCGVCVIAMLTDLSYEKVLADMPNYRATSNHDWMRYLNLLGFQIDQVDENALPVGRRLYCGVIATLNREEIRHAIAVDEEGRIFDPANGAPEPGKFTLQQCVAYGTFKIHGCFTVRDRRLM